MNPRLTLNLGLRYQYFSPDTLEDDIYTNFDPALWKSKVAPEVLPNGQLALDSQGRPLTSTGEVAQIYNGLNCPGRDRQFGNPVYHCPGTHRGIFPPWKRGFAPRVGAAWDIFGNGKTSLRGGDGIGYSRLSFPQFGSLSNPPFVLTVTRFGGTLTDPSFGSEIVKSPSPITYVFPDAKPTRVHSWSLSFQRELVSNAVLDVAYVGSKAQRLHPYVDFNFPAIGTKPSIADPNCLQPGQDPNGTYDFDPCINSFVATPDYTRPFKGWGNMDTYYGGGPNFGFSNYHSLQAGFKYKTTRGLNLTTAYTWGKALSNVKGNGGDPWSGGRGAQNPKRFDLEYGPTGFDRTHILNIGYVYQLPLWRSRKDWRGQVFGHWTLSGITYLMSGFPYYPYLATPTPGLAQRPNVLPGINVKGPKTVEKWFNTETFVEPAWGFFGNAGTGIIRGPGEHTWHTALYKAFPIREKTKLQFRAEFYNMFNHPNFDSIGVGLGAGNFGQVISAKEPRILQFGLRLDF